MITIQDALTLATENGMNVSDYYRDMRKGQKVSAFKVYEPGNAAAPIVIKQKAKGSKSWCLGQKGVSAMIDTQAKCIVEAVRILLNGRAWR